MANESSKMIKTCEHCRYFSVTNKKKGYGECKLYSLRHPPVLDEKGNVEKPGQTLRVYGYFKCNCPQLFIK